MFTERLLESVAYIGYSTADIGVVVPAGNDNFTKLNVEADNNGSSTAGLTKKETLILGVLAQHEGFVSSQDLANLVAVSHVRSVSPFIRGLRRKGFDIAASQGSGYSLANEQRAYALQTIEQQKPEEEIKLQPDIFSEADLTNPEKKREIELVISARSGSEDSFSDLYSEYYPRVYRYVLARTGNSFDAEDATSDIFLKVLEALPRYRFTQAPFSAWLFRIAHNAIISKRRLDGTRGRSVSLRDDRYNPSTECDEIGDQLSDKIQLQEALKVIEFLPDKYKQVILYRFIQGLNVAETASRMNKGTGNVKVIQYKAVIRLRELIAGGMKNGSDPDKPQNETQISAKEPLYMQVLKTLISGKTINLSDKQIANAIGVNVKSIGSAIQYIRRKYKIQFEGRQKKGYSLPNSSKKDIEKIIQGG